MTVPLSDGHVAVAGQATPRSKDLPLGLPPERCLFYREALNHTVPDVLPTQTERLFESMSALQ